MTIRAVEAMAGIGWLKNGFNLGRRNPGALFGGAALLMVAVIGLAAVVGLLAGVTTAILGNSFTAVMVGLLVVTLPVVALLGMLVVGYMRLVDAVGSGRSARAVDVFAGFSDLPTSMRAIGLLLLVVIIQNLLLLGLLYVLAGDFLQWYAQVLQASANGADPSAAMEQLPTGVGMAYLVMGLVGTLFFGVQAAGLGQVVLGGRGVLAGLGDGFTAAFKNLLPLLMLFLASILAMVVFMVVVAIGVLIVGLVIVVVSLLLQDVAGMWLALVIGVPLYLAFLLATVVVSFGVMYHLWRDVCGSESAPLEPLNA